MPRTFQIRWVFSLSSSANSFARFSGISVVSHSGMGWRAALRKLLLSRRCEDNLKAQLGCFPLEGVDLALAVACLVKYRALVHKLHPVAEHSIHESGQLGCHSLNRDRSLKPRPQSPELGTQVCIAFAQGTSCTPQGGGQPVVRPQPPFPNHFLSADSVVRTQSQPGNEMIF